MQTLLAGTLDLDRDRVAEELATAAAFAWSHAYSDYLCGGPWRSCMLWAPGADAGDGLVNHYNHGAAPGFSANGSQLPYLRKLVEENFDLGHLNFARLATVSNSVIIPHRDLLELGDIPAGERNTHRVHVPLVTPANCWVAERNTVYWMQPGDVWFFDASQVHSVAALSDQDRTHLILDFTDVTDPHALMGFDVSGPAGIPAERVRDRPPMDEAERAALARLAQVITLDNWRDVFSIVIKAGYRHDGGESFVWDTLSEIGRHARAAGVSAKIQELQRYFLLERTEGTVPS